MIRFLLVTLSFLIPFPAAAEQVVSTNPRAVFARHDPGGRLPNTDIRELGMIRIHGTIYSIFYLNFVNPVSRHGQQRIAIIKNGTEFAGAYECVLGPGKNEGKLFIGKDRLTVKIADLTFVIGFDEEGPTRNKYFCGEGSGWEDSI